MLQPWLVAFLKASYRDACDAHMEDGPTELEKARQREAGGRRLSGRG